MSTMTRRSFLKYSIAAAAAASLPSVWSRAAGANSDSVEIPLARQAISSLSWLKRPYTMVVANSTATGKVKENITGML